MSAGLDIDRILYLVFYHKILQIQIPKKWGKGGGGGITHNIYFANQWTDVCIIGTTVMKELNTPLECLDHSALSLFYLICAAINYLFLYDGNIGH